MANQVIEYKANNEEVKLSPTIVRQFLVSGNAEVTDQEVVMFMQLAKYQHLNPFLNEAYLVKFQGRPAQIITSKEAFMKRANANPHYKGMDAGIIVARGDEMVQLNGTVKMPSDKLIGGWATVKRDDREDTHVELSMEEFSKGQATWKNMPATMIRKSAIVNALREAFPQELGALYTEDDKQPSDGREPARNASEDVPDLKELVDKQDAEPEESTEPEVKTDAKGNDSEPAEHSEEQSLLDSFDATQANAG
ncbi:phage recombination protein Bet [Lacticaseibacillus nasuensis]|uniref:Phage recombination protein Bet n=1 Tax=Lacticaseibacillus nasuensis JCM 17158 TaxID=1291734 RepID=A0A0R1JKP3_9LACO|nr:phage recombination protein Bet [Lacticaseibacillus nasuensis]KRK71886.1 phage recombination protein Bet [Lacticaseibacillus nasuensis JCM 17158]